VPAPPAGEPASPAAAGHPERTSEGEERSARIAALEAEVASGAEAREKAPNLKGSQRGDYWEDSPIRRQSLSKVDSVLRDFYTLSSTLFRPGPPQM
jgi:hypothetical protein